MNYAARSFGIKRSSHIKDVLAKCPDIHFGQIPSYCVDSCPECNENMTYDPNSRKVILTEEDFKYNYGQKIPKIHKKSDHFYQKASLHTFRDESERIFNTLRNDSYPSLEQVSIDEAYIDLGTQFVGPILRLTPAFILLQSLLRKAKEWTQKPNEKNQQTSVGTIDILDDTSQDNNINNNPSDLSTSSVHNKIDLSDKDLYNFPDYLAACLSKDNITSTSGSDTETPLSMIDITQRKAAEDLLILAKACSESLFSADNCIQRDELLAMDIQAFSNLVSSFALLSNSPIDAFARIYDTLVVYKAEEGKKHVTSKDLQFIGLRNKQLSLDSMVTKENILNFISEISILIGAFVTQKGLVKMRESSLEYSLSGGVAHSRMLAKLCSATNKPAKLSILTWSAEKAFLKGLPVRDLPLLGGKLGTLVASLSQHNGSKIRKQGVHGGAFAGDGEFVAESSDSDSEDYREILQRENQSTRNKLMASSTLTDTRGHREVLATIDTVPERRRGDDNDGSERDTTVGELWGLSTDEIGRRLRIEREFAEFIRERLHGGHGHNAKAFSVGGMASNLVPSTASTFESGRKSILSSKNFGSSPATCHGMLLPWLRVQVAEIIHRSVKEFKKNKRWPRTLSVSISAKFLDEIQQDGRRGVSRTKQKQGPSPIAPPLSLLVPQVGEEMEKQFAERVIDEMGFLVMKTVVERIGSILKPGGKWECWRIGLNLANFEDTERSQPRLDDLLKEASFKNENGIVVSSCGREGANMIRTFAGHSAVSSHLQSTELLSPSNSLQKQRILGFEGSSGAKIAPNMTVGCAGINYRFGHDLKRLDELNMKKKRGLEIAFERGRDRQAMMRREFDGRIELASSHSSNIVCDLEDDEFYNTDGAITDSIDDEQHLADSITKEKVLSNDDTNTSSAVETLDPILSSLSKTATPQQFNKQNATQIPEHTGEAFKAFFSPNAAASNGSINNNATGFNFVDHKKLSPIASCMIKNKNKNAEGFNVRGFLKDRRKTPFKIDAFFEKTGRLYGQQPSNNTNIEKNAKNLDVKSDENLLLMPGDVRKRRRQSNESTANNDTDFEEDVEHLSIDD